MSQYLPLSWPLLALFVAQVMVGPAMAQEDPEEKAAETQSDLLLGQMLAPKAFRAAAAKIMPSVVTIESFGGLSTSRKGAIGGIRRPGDGPTTGLIISPEGHVLTSTFNFIRQQPVITVVLQDGSRHVAEMLGRDETRKLCILKIRDAEGLPVAQIAPRKDLQVGQWAISVGVGFGDTEPAISAGIISARNRIAGRAEQTDANISPANYGGPLVDIEGRVIGICVPLSPQSQDVGAGVEWYDSGIGFAVPLDGAEKMLTAMKEGKVVLPAQLGVQTAPGGEEGGVLAKKVQPKSAADKAGMKDGDRIVKFDGEDIKDFAHLRKLLGGHVAGDEVVVVVQRDGMELKLEIKLEAAAKAKKPNQPNPPFKLPIPRPKN